MRRAALLVPAFAMVALAGSAVRAQSSCSSDRQLSPSVLVERFINADCDTCWADASTMRTGRRELPLDWIVPGARGDDAPLAMAANGDALDRLQALGRGRPLPTDAVRGARQPAAGSLRVAHGLPFNGYIGTSIEMRAAEGGPWTAWLALVETLPAGTEGSPVERNLVRNLLQLPWPAGARRHFEARPMAIPEGTHPDRLRVVGWIEDSRGAIRAISASRCGPATAER
ncbi:hypothetical protein ACPWT1_12490 [Ramlibacter sp. MMS24-I3-19]|uniref:hypothetical protein n=1 Tax=Ramlibacter sp. MMS24-I3-19 TaxID=3416606 RepID=UPI003D033729